MENLLHLIFSQNSLFQSWSELCERAKTENGRTKEFDQFEKALAQNILTIAQAGQKGQWHPSPVRQARIRKESGGFRSLGIPILSDRMVERSALGVLDPIVDAHLLPWSFAYRRGLGVNDAIGSLIECRDDGANYVLRCDVKDCFQNIPHQPLKNELSRIFEDPELLRFLDQFIERPILGKKSIPSKGIHQGSPLSPLFSNVFLNSLDHHIITQGFPIIRYSDDIAISVSHRHEADLALSQIRRFLKIHGMKLSEEKVHIHSFDEGVPFLGQLITSSSLITIQAHPKLVSLYVSEQGSLLRSKGKRLRVELPDESTFSIGFERLNNVVIFGRIGLTTPVMQQFMRRGIDLTLLSETGSYIGRLEGMNSGNPFLRSHQYEKARSSEIRLRYAKQFVEAKILNQRILLLKYARRYALQDAPAIIRLPKLRAKVESSQNLQSLMGIEGITARDYFQTIRILVGSEWGFDSRRRRPPPDPINSMLSFGYSLLTQEVISAVNTVGLDPYMGFLHHPRIGRPSLALDLIEEFRTPIVDSLVLKLVFTNSFSPKDFSFLDGESPSCLLLPEARKRFLAAYERRMLTLFTHIPTGRRVTWRQSLGLQSRKLADSLMREDIQYTPIIWK